jgi:hypothetical protein
MLFVVVIAGCGDDGAKTTPDAPVIHLDASPDSAPDAPVCAAPSKTCGTVCTPVATDEANCGDCGVVCHGGEACTGSCTCPAQFIPSDLPSSGFDQFANQGTLLIAIGPSISGGGINPMIFGYSATTALNTDIDLSTIAVGDAPFVAAGYGFDTSAMTLDATYLATSGTLRLTKRCETEVQGTLTNATFKGATGGFGSPAVDPMGCTLTVPSMTFHVMTAACP